MRLATDPEKFATILERWVPMHRHGGVASQVAQDGDKLIAVCKCGVALAVALQLWRDVDVWIGGPAVCPICNRTDPHLHGSDGSVAPERP